APIGHLIAIPAFADETLFGFDRVWAAAGAHDAVFAAEPHAMVKAAQAVVATLAV
ncbi:MAG: YbaK/EbsC family protein, partial [Mesorhizobium sp.]